MCLLIIFYIQMKLFVKISIWSNQMNIGWIAISLLYIRLKRRQLWSIFVLNLRHCVHRRKKNGFLYTRLAQNESSKEKTNSICNSLPGKLKQYDKGRITYSIIYSAVARKTNTAINENDNVGTNSLRSIDSYDIYVTGSI